MDWKKVKNYTISSLIILNVILLVLNLSQCGIYRLKQSNKNAIINVLARDNITVECAIPDNFKPMTTIKLKPFNHDIIELQRIFIENSNDLKKTKEFGSTIIKNETEKLTIQDNNVFYSNTEPELDFELSKRDAEKKFKKLLNEINKQYGKMYLSRYVEAEDYIIFEYNQKFSDKILFDNFVNVYVYKNGSMDIEFSYIETIGRSGENIEICSPDEALYVFYNESNKLIEEDEFAIEKIDLGYFSNSKMQDETTQILGVPHYRILLKDVSIPFYINAFTSEMVFY